MADAVFHTASVLTIVLGWSLVFRSAGLGLYLVMLAVGFHLRVVLYEERVLARQFGAEWSAYSASVGRWVPSVKRKKDVDRG